MKNEQLMVNEFMETFGQRISEHIYVPTEPERISRARMILEEALETATALLAGTRVTNIMIGETTIPVSAEARKSPVSLHHVVDGCIDTMYVTLGTLSLCGVDAERCFETCHASNMTKFWPYKPTPLKEYHVIRTNHDRELYIVSQAGKVVKPPGFQPPKYYFE